TSLLCRHASVPHPSLLSFPTRRSSDLPSDAKPLGADCVQNLAPSLPTPVLRHRQSFAGGSHVRSRAVVGQNERPRTGRHLGEPRSEEHTSELQSRENLVCRLLLEKKNT